VRLRRSIAPFVAAATIFSAVQPARAQDGDIERARALFEEAGELERHGQWSAAQDKLRAAIKIRETPHLRYALGWALENDDKLLEAKVEYETAARLGRERAGAEEAARLAVSRLAELEKKTPVIKVRVGGGAKANARVIVDGREIKRDDDIAAAPVNPGSHVIRVERPSDGPSGRAPITTEQMVYVGRGTIQTVDIDAGEAVAVRDSAQDRHGRVPSRSPVARRPATTEDGSVVPWVLFTGGLAFVAGGGALLISANGDANDRDAAQARWCTATACSGGTTATRAETPEAASYRREASEAADTGNTKQAFGLAVGGAGLIAATVGAILLLRDDTHPEKPVTRARASAAPLPGGAFASAAFTF
jgi:hypothetical protein